MGKNIRLIFNTVNSPKIIIYSKGRFKGLSLSYKNSLNSFCKSELVCGNKKILDDIQFDLPQVGGDNMNL